MSRAQSFDRVEFGDLRVGDRIIAFRAVDFAPSQIHVETFHSLHHMGKARIRLRLKDKKSRHDIYITPENVAGWRFYRKVKR